MTGLNIAAVAALVGDPGRANMLAALLDGRALTATELAGVAGVTPATASGHLSKLTTGGLLSGAAQGRHRYFRLASAEVARMLEAILLVADGADEGPRATPRVPAALREARTCYDHLAGRAAVALTDALLAKGAIVLAGEAGEVTALGHDLLGGFGVALDRPSRSRRIYCRPCLDWSERRPHIGGHVGAALFDRLLEIGWMHRAKTGRAVLVSPRGRLGLRETFGCRIGDPEPQISL